MYRTPFVKQQRALKLKRAKELRRAGSVKKTLNANLSPPTYTSSGSELLGCCRPPLGRGVAAGGSASWRARKEGCVYPSGFHFRETV